MSAESELASLNRLQDRIDGTSNEKLSNLLHIAVPALIKLVNKDDLRARVFQMFGPLLKRLKNLTNCDLPLKELIELVRQKHQPYACNFSMTFIDVAWDRQQGKSVELTLTLLESIMEWPLYSPQSNALLAYIWKVVPFLPSALDAYKDKANERKTFELRHLLSDYMLDLCLVHGKSIKRGGAGSVLPGLSDERVMRLTAKRDEIDPTVHLREHKLEIVELLLDDRVVEPWAAIAISMVLSYDSDENVAQAAVFKMNAQRNRVPLDGDAGTALLAHILHIVCPASAPLPTEYLASSVDGAASSVSPYSKPRSMLRDEIRSHLLRWCASEAAAHVASVGKSVLKVFLDTTLVAGASTVRYRAAVTLLANSLTEHMSDNAFISSVQLIIKSVEKVLETYVTRSVESDLSDGITTRKSCYAMLERVALKAPLLAIRSASVVSIMFRLLDNETETLLPKLYAALGSLREAYQNRLRLVDDAAPIVVDDAKTDGKDLADSEVLSSRQLQMKSAITQAEIATRSSQKLKDVIVIARESGAQKKRLAALQWSRAVFDWDPITIETMATLADDTSPSVSEAAAKEFRNLRESITEDHGRVLLGIMNSKVIKNTNDNAAIARIEVFSSLSVYFQHKRANYIGTAASHSAHLLGKQRWTSLLFDPVSEDAEELVATVDVIFHHNMAKCTNETLKQRILEASTQLLLDMLSHRNIPALRVKARQYDKVLLSWMKDVPTAYENPKGYIESIASVLGMASLDSLDSFMKGIREALNHDHASAGISTSATRRKYLEYQQQIRMYSFSTILQACEARFKVKVYNSLVAECKEVQKALFSVYHDVLNADNGYSSDTVGVALKTYSQILCYGVFIDEMMKSVATFNASASSFAPAGTATRVPLQERIFSLVQSFIIKSRPEQASSNTANGTVMEGEQGNSISLSNGGVGGVEAMIASLGVEALGNFCIWGFNDATSDSDREAFVGRIWVLLCSKIAWMTDSTHLRFAIAEALVRISAQSSAASAKPLIFPSAFEKPTEVITPYQGARALDTLSEIENRGLPVTVFVDDDSLGNIPSALKNVLSMVDTVVIQSTEEPSLTKAKGTASAILLVFLRFYRSICRSAYSEDMPDGEDFISLSFLTRLTDVLLRLLNDSQASTQDVACLALCHLHYMAKFIPGVSSNGKTAVEVLSTEVINTLAREKRTMQSSAGTGPTSATTGDSDTTSNEANGNDNSAGDENRRANAQRDALAAAAATAAAELGTNIEERVALERATSEAAAANPVAARPLPAWRQRDVNPSNYGVYSTAIKVARKSGDASVVFGVLSLIRRDPSFGAKDSDTESLYKRYEAPIAAVERSRIKSLLPMLLLAKHDPYTSVRNVMKALWDILVTPEYQRLVVPLQARIMDYLVQNLTSANWRDREAACSALQSFLIQLDWIQIRPRVVLMWSGGMSVLDDIRDSTRVAAVGYMKVLSDQILRACTPIESSKERVLECAGTMLPILMDRGLVAPTPEGRGAALGVLVRIVKASKGLLEPWLPRLVSVMCEAMSAMEPQTLQYMSFHTARLNISDEELEKKRLELSQHSPMQEALDECLQNLSISNLDETLFVLWEQLSRGVGLTTRATAATSLSYLAEKYQGELGSNADKSFKEVINLLLQAPNMSLSLKQTLYGCVGSLGKIANAKTLEGTCEKLVTIYNSLGRETRTESAAVVASCIRQVINRCSNKLVDHDVWTLLLACVYVGTFDSDADTKSIWNSVYSEVLSQSGAGNKLTAILRVLVIVLSTANNYLHDLSWTRRLHGLALLDDLTKTLPGDQLGPNLGPAVLSLLNLIPGHIWDGQEMVLDVLVKIVCKCNNLDFSASRELVLLSSFRGASDAEPKTVLSFEDVMNLDRNKLTNADVATVRSSVVAPNKWGISLRGFTSLLINEAGRGNRAYKLRAAASLADLPWSNIVNSETGSTIFSELFSIFAATAGIPPFVPEELHNLLASRASADQKDSEKIEAKVTVQQQIRAKTRPSTYKKQDSSLSLFGGRYSGSDPTHATSTSSKRKFTHRSESAAPGLDDQAEREVVLHNPLTKGAIYGIGAPVGSTLGSGSRLQEKQQRDSMEAGESGSVKQSALADDMVMAEEVEIETTREIPAYDIKADAATNTSSLEEKEKDYFVEGHRIPVSSDPAFKIKFVECLVKGWDGRAIETAVGIANAREAVMTWTRTSVTSEFWGVRRSALQLLTVVLKDPSYEASVDALSKAVDTVAAGAKDAKYAKVRISAFDCLIAILENQLAKLNRGSASLGLETSETVRVLLRNAANDSEPSLLQAATKAQTIWLGLKG